MGTKAYIAYDDAMKRVEKAMFIDNKISIELLAGDYPFLSRFLQALDSAEIGDGVKSLAELFISQKEQLQELFFDQAQTIQIATLKKQFASQLAALGETEIQKLYEGMSSGAKYQAEDFKHSVKQAIDEYLKNSTVQQLLALWKQKPEAKQQQSGVLSTKCRLTCCSASLMRLIPLFQWLMSQKLIRSAF